MRQFNFIAASALGAGLLATPIYASAQAQTAAPAAAPAVEPAAIKALETMGAYLRTLTAFEMKADVVADEVTDDGRKLQLGSTITYQVRKPSQFTIDTVSDRKVRKLYYDGKQITLFAPKVGFYARRRPRRPSARPWTSCTTGTTSKCRWRICSGGVSLAIAATS